MSFRLEYATSARSGCKAAECITQGIKIEKNELRHVSFFTIGGSERQGRANRHWGCVTPRQIANIKKAIEDNLDYLDGYDDLKDEDKAKVRQALADGHVADEDWRHDLEMNRPGKIGVKSPARKAQEKAEKKAADEHGQSESPSKPAPKRKRTRAKKEGGSEVESDVEVVPKKKSRAAPKRVKKEEVSEAEPDAEEVSKKKSRAVPKRSRKEDNSDTGSVSEVLPIKKSRAAPTRVNEVDEDEAEAETSTKARPKKSRVVPMKVKSEVAKNDGLSADNAPLVKTSGRQSERNTTRVKAEQSAGGEEVEEGSEVQHDIATSSINKAKKATSKVSRTAKVKKEEGDSDVPFEAPDIPKARIGRGRKALEDSTSQAPAKQVKTKRSAANGQVTRSSKD